MNQKESPAGKRGQYIEQDKDSTYSVIRKVRKLFYEGGSYTAVQINAHTGGSDARKRISEFRQQGMNIVDLWLPNPRRKLYWHEPSLQPTLFDNVVE